MNSVLKAAKRPPCKKTKHQKRFFHSAYDVIDILHEETTFFFLVSLHQAGVLTLGAAIHSALTRDHPLHG